VAVNLTNHLPDMKSLAAGTPVIFPNGTSSPTSLDPKTLQHFGDGQVDAIITGLPIGGTKVGDPVPNPQFVFARWPMACA